MDRWGMGDTRYGVRDVGLDWRLITAQMYQESRFDPKAKSWVGAKGLMQVMPRTGAELKIYDLESPDQGILAGTRVMARYSNFFNNNRRVLDRAGLSPARRCGGVMGLSLDFRRI